ncbi:MAG: methyltransferase domain-containing protein [Chitinophagaceae bacterium]|nr:methyltransferase domain-containing protein [Chitinophagaceae bacterium]
MSNKETSIISSWHSNAAAWIDIISRQGIASRTLATNKAIIDAVIEQHPKTVLDLGCGEGWLCRELAKRGVQVTGTDISPELIRKAGETTDGKFFVASYEDISAGHFVFENRFDVIVINFALLGKESVENLLSKLPSLLLPGGVLLIQTLHPIVRIAMGDYTTGWKEGSWDGLGEQFVQPYQWYFRTLEDWLDLLVKSGFSAVQHTTVSHPETAVPLSLILACRTT